MPAHNPFSEEVWTKRNEICDYGGLKKYINAPGHTARTYKEQALVELAARLEADQKIWELEAVLDIVHNVVDCFDCYTAKDDWSRQQLKRLYDAVRKPE